MKKYGLWIFCFLMAGSMAKAQIVITNKNFSMGTTGRIGAGISPSLPEHTGRQLNLIGQGSLGSRLEQGDYVDFLPAFHFKAVNANNDSTHIDFQARLAFYSSKGTFLGNVNTGSIGGTVVSLPEAFVEVRNIVGSKWSAWAGARYMRYDDIHICDYFYFDDHSTQGFGIKHKNTAFSMYFPAAIDTSSTGVLPYSYVNIISGKNDLTYRQREIFVLDHTLRSWPGHVVKLLGEFHHVAGSSQQASIRFPSDNGWVWGVKWSADIKTKEKGSFNQLAVRYGNGVANGGDNGNTQTWRTYGAPNIESQRYDGAYSATLVEHFLLNFKKCSLNGYGVYIQSQGGGKARGFAQDYYKRSIYNSKKDLVVGMRAITYVTNWFHLITELHYAQRQDGNNPYARMTKFIIAPTLVPTAERSPWARPHIRLICSFAHYNQYASDHAYSAYLQQAVNHRWGTYFGVRSEWWIF
ncbi:carbohydrate porin [Siphonobacter sp. SORGH_AS_1065]|uniref:carbohydrate porin n=1 Tax=Siphonobacter sp. SORGH_AS_1065 TaxID=3041795 RepID=UPI002785CCEC|nr:carbohydrate porin [Siphonobacter sp. SORGH_AS_1065]MDQ1086137.1 maltoporin [Siphonobacter sp. SORGH_AS_1065]